MFPSSRVIQGYLWLEPAQVLWMMSYHCKSICHPVPGKHWFFVIIQFVWLLNNFYFFYNNPWALERQNVMWSHLGSYIHQPLEAIFGSHHVIQTKVPLRELKLSTLYPAFSHMWWWFFVFFFCLKSHSCCIAFSNYSHYKTNWSIMLLLQDTVFMFLNVTPQMLWK